MNTGSRHRVAVIGGDGIGPEVCAEALKVVAASGVDLDTTDFDLGAARYLRDGTVLPGRDAGGAPRLRRDPSRRRRPARGRHVGAAGHPRARPAAQDPFRARPLRQPAPLQRGARVDRRGRGLRGGAREHRRDVRRRGRLPAQGDPLRGGHPGLGEHPDGRRALRALRLRAGRPAQQPPHARAQDERADLRRRSVEPHRHRGGARLPRRGLGLQPRRRRLHLSGGAAEALRRHRHRQPLRRHPHRPRRRRRRRDRLRRLGQPEPGPHRAVPLRARARRGPRHRGPGHRQPAGRHPLGGPHAGPPGRGRCRRRASSRR